MQSIQLATLDIDALRTRLRKMSDEELPAHDNHAALLHTQYSRTIVCRRASW